MAFGIRAFRKADLTQTANAARATQNSQQAKSSASTRPIMTGLKRVGNMFGRRDPQVARGQVQPKAPDTQSSRPPVNATEVRIKEQAKKPNSPQAPGKNMSAQDLLRQVSKLVDIGIATKLDGETKEDSVMGTLKRALKRQQGTNAKQALLKAAQIAVKSNEHLTPKEKNELTNSLDKLMVDVAIIGGRNQAKASGKSIDASIVRRLGQVLDNTPADKRANILAKIDSGLNRKTLERNSKEAVMAYLTDYSTGSTKKQTAIAENKAAPVTNTTTSNRALPSHHSTAKPPTRNYNISTPVSDQDMLDLEDDMFLQDASDLAKEWDVSNIVNDIKKRRADKSNKSRPQLSFEGKKVSPEPQTKTNISNKTESSPIDYSNEDPNLMASIANFDASAIGSATPKQSLSQTEMENLLGESMVNIGLGDDKALEELMKDNPQAAAVLGKAKQQNQDLEAVNQEFLKRLNK